MARLNDRVPSWVASYVGLEWRDGGRSRDGVDCWGLTWLVFAQRFGIALPALSYGSVDDHDAVSAAAEAARGDGDTWVPVPPTATQVGDVGQWRLAGRPHVGTAVARGRVLHILAGVNACVERIDTPTWECRFVGWWRFNGAVRLVEKPSVFRTDVVRHELEAGGTILELLAAAGIVLVAGLRVVLGDRVVPEDRWALVRPRPGRSLVVTVVPAGTGQDGGKTAARLIATIAVIAVAAYLGPVVAGASASLATTGLATAAIGLAGSLAVNALIGAPKPRLSTEGDTRASPTLTGARNELRPFQVVPRVLGAHRMTPPLAAPTFSEVAGDDQYLRMLFAPGYGPLELSDFRIGDTPLEEFDGVEIEVRSGRDGEDPCSLYPDTIREESLSVLLSSDGGWVQRTTPVDVTEISVDVTFPQGLVSIGPTGDRENVTVDVEIQYRLEGTVPWLGINGDGGATGSPLDFRQMDLLFREPEVLFGGAGIHTGRVAWSFDQVAYPDAKPAYLLTAGYSWIVEGAIFAPTTGSYRFTVDSSDASDCHVDGREVASWYGGHLTEVTEATIDSTTRAGAAIHLAKGWHSFRARVEHRGGTGGAFAVAWKKPGDSAFAVIPSTSFSREMRSNPTGELNYGWYHTFGYASIITTTEARAEVIRRTLAWAVPSGRYEVRLLRRTPDTDDATIVDDVYWTTLRTISRRDPIRLARQARIALRIKATDQLNGVIDDFNCMAKSVVPDYDAASGTWIERTTSSPASLYRAVLQSSGARTPIADSRLDVAEFEAWHTECVERGLEFNGIIDFGGTVFERLSDVAAAGRATFGMRDSLFSIVRDRVQTVPAQHFTPRNSTGFRGRKAFTDLPHALRMWFTNRDAGYVRDVRVVPADGYQVDGFTAFGEYRPDLPAATLFETIELFGCTDAAQAFRHGRYLQAVAKLRPEVFSLGTDIEHLVCSRGDLVLVSHDVPLFGSGYGRVVGLITDVDNNLTGLVVDEPVVMDVTQPYVVRVRLEDNTSFLRDIITNAGPTTTILLAGPVASGSPMPKVGDLWMFGIMGRETRECLVKSIDVDRNLGATLELLDHAPAVHEADQGEIPDFDSGITQPPDVDRRPDPPVIESIRSDDLVMVRDADGSLRQRMLITLRTPSGSGPIPTYAQARTRQSGSNASWTHHAPTPIDGHSVSIFDVVEGVTYDIRLRVLTDDGRASDWTSATHLVVGKSSPPPNVQSFECVRLSDGTRRFSWVLGIVPPDIAGVQIRYGLAGQTWDQMSLLQTETIEATPWETYDPPAGTWKLGIKMVDTSGNQSVDALFITRTLGEPPLLGIIKSEDAGLLGWPGTKTQCHVAGPVLEADDPTTWDQLPGAGAPTWDQWARWNISPRSPIVYEHPPLDAGFVFEFSPDAIVVAEGDALVELSWSSDGVDYSAWADRNLVRSQSVTARYLKSRVTVDQNATVNVAVISRFVVMMRAESRTHAIQDLDTSTLAGRIIGVGDVYLPLPDGYFQKLTSVQLSFNGTGGGYSWELVEKSVVTGPRVRIYDSAGARTHALIDALIRGF